MTVYRLQVAIPRRAKLVSGTYSTMEKAIAEASRVQGKQLMVTQALENRWFLHANRGEFPVAQIDTITK